MSSPADDLGFAIAPTRRLSIEAALELIVLAETLGYSSVWVPETWGPDAVSLLAAAAVRTSRIRLATGVLNVFSRSPALIAQTAASLHELSGGRFVLGLGTSGPGVVEPWHGVPFDRPIERTRQYVEIVRLALSGGPVDYSMWPVSLRGFKLNRPPEGEIPIYIAALGPRNIRLAGEIADGWLPIFAMRGHLSPLVALLEEGALASGRDPASIDIAAFIPAAIGKEGERQLRHQIAYYVGGMGAFYLRFLRRAGLEDEALLIRRLWQSGERRAAGDAVAPRILELCTLGWDVASAFSRIAEFRRGGVRLPILAMPHGLSADEIADTLTALSPSPPRDA